MRNSFRNQLINEVKRFKDIKRALEDLRMDLDEHELNALSTKIMGEIAVTMDSDFFRIKSSDDYIPYFGGIMVKVNEISRNTNNELTCKIQKNGKDSPVQLSGKQAALFLALLILKYENPDQDATAGFQALGDSGITGTLETLAKNSGTELTQWSFATMDNLRRKVRTQGLYETLQGLPDDSYRLAVSPIRIVFEPEAQAIFERYSQHSYSSFCKRFSYDPEALKRYFGVLTPQD